MYDMLMHGGSLSSIVTSRAPSHLQMLAGSLAQQQQQNAGNLSPEEEMRWKNLREQLLMKMHQQQQSGGGDGDSSASSSSATSPQFAISNAHVEFAIDYRKAIPFAFVNMCVYFMNLFCDTIDRDQLATENLKNQILYDRARLITCIHCSRLNVWSENEVPVLTCVQCMSNMVWGILEGIVAISRPITTTPANNATSNNINTGNSNRDSVAAHQATEDPLVKFKDNKVLKEIVIRLQRQGFFCAVCEQAALFLRLFKTKFVLLAKAGAVVTHPDRVFADEEFSSLVEIASKSSSSSFGLSNCKGIVLGVSRPQFVEPSGVLDDWMPGLRIENTIKRNKVDLTKMSNASTKKQKQSAVMFPPWLRDEDNDQETIFDEENCNNRRDSDDDDDNDAEENGTDARKIKQNTNKMMTKTKKEITRKLENASSLTSSLVMRWQALHQEDAANQRRIHHHNAVRRKRRQDDKHHQNQNNDDDDEWETVI